MIELEIPGWEGAIRLMHLVVDVNGTLAVDGELREDAAELLGRMRDQLELHLVTGNIHGKQAEIDRRLNVQAYCLPSGNEREAKAAYIRSLGCDSVVAIGQGGNDAGMLGEARIGICVLSPEGLAADALLAADVVAVDIVSALDLLLHPLRLVGTLRK
jgi:P-type E1-E2 ATPase